MSLAIAVGVLGTLAGLAAGWAGTYLAIASAAGPRERSFMVRGALGCWVAVAVVVTSPIFLPDVWPGVMVVAALVMPWGVRQWNERQEAIREEERGQRLRTSTSSGETKRL